MLKLIFEYAVSFAIALGITAAFFGIIVVIPALVSGKF